MKMPRPARQRKTGAKPKTSQCSNRKDTGLMKIRIPPTTINDNSLTCQKARCDKILAIAASRKIARKYGFCPATSALVARLAGLGPRGWRL